MLTQQQTLDAVKSGRESDALDGRDYSRLAAFFPEADLETFGFKLKEGEEKVNYVPKPWTREEVLKQLESDVDFGFEKALDRRGISASLMYSVVKMWMWVLEDPLQHMEEYAQYGLPLFKAVAVKYGFPNLIGDKTGSEYCFSAQGGW